MARKYETTEIDGIKYELHGVKAGDKKIGLVPIRCFENSDEFRDFIHDSTAGDLELVAADFRYGNAVRLQGMARKVVSGGGYTEADHNKIFNELSLADPNWLQGFAGKGNELDKACKVEWQRRKDENPNDDFDADYVWDELVQ